MHEIVDIRHTIDQISLPTPRSPTLRTFQQKINYPEYWISVEL